MKTKQNGRIYSNNMSRGWGCQFLKDVPKVLKVIWCGILVGISSFCSSRSLSFERYQSPTAFSSLDVFVWIQELHCWNCLLICLYCYSIWGLVRVTTKGIQFQCGFKDVSIDEFLPDSWCRVVFIIFSLSLSLSLSLSQTSVYYT